ncbi:hypothetical protein MHU86_18975 [Fragilaria crotonensis]|nr:hypothetical protein MHU86_18975 [Fragilaria crotonensis]
MFLPNVNADAEKAALKEHCDRIERWALDIIPSDIREEVVVSVQEVQCGDPECAPIDTVITVLFDSGGRGMFGLPLGGQRSDIGGIARQLSNRRILAQVGSRRGSGMASGTSRRFR